MSNKTKIGLEKGCMFIVNSFSDENSVEIEGSMKRIYASMCSILTQASAF